MMYDEFIKLAGPAALEMTPSEYADTVEVVYMYHPAINDAGGKQQIVEFYKADLIRDMLPRAKLIMQLEQSIRERRRHIDEIKAECERRILEEQERIVNLKSELNKNREPR